MHRIAVYLTKMQIAFLKSLPGNMSEHIRRAIDEYTQKIERERVSTTKSNG